MRPKTYQSGALSKSLGKAAAKKKQSWLQQPDTNSKCKSFMWADIANNVEPQGKFDIRALRCITIHDDLVRHGARGRGPKYFNQHSYHKHVVWVGGIEDVNSGGSSVPARSSQLTNQAEQASQSNLPASCNSWPGSHSKLASQPPSQPPGWPLGSFGQLVA